MFPFCFQIRLLQPTTPLLPAPDPQLKLTPYLFEQMPHKEITSRISARLSLYRELNEMKNVPDWNWCDKLLALLRQSQVNESMK